MRIWQAQRFGEPAEVLQLVDMEPPTMGEGGFTLKMKACGLGLPDVFMTKGHYPLVLSPPVSPGQEMVGEVIAVASGCEYKVGDRVMTTTAFQNGWGGFAEMFVSQNGKEFSSLAPEQLSDAQAAGFLIPYHTAHGGLIQRGALKAGETVLILGASGSSGSSAIQVAKAAGATVIACASSAEKLDFCASIGADHGINYRTETVSERVMELTGGHGADVIYDPVGGKAAADAVKAIAHDGRFVLIGFASGSWFEASVPDMVERSYSVVGAFMFKRTAAQKAQARADLAAWVRDGKINPPVDETFAFEDAVEMMQKLQDGSVLGKLSLRGVV